MVDKIERHSPGFKDLIVHMEVRTPHEIESEIGLTEGNIFQGELTIDQLLFNRPFPGYGQYRMPVEKPLHERFVHASRGRRVLGDLRGQRRAGDSACDLKRPNTVPEDDCYDE